MKAEHSALMKEMNSEITRYLDELQAISQLSHDDLQERALTYIKKQLAHATRSSPFYQQKYNDGDMTDHIHDLKDMESIPYTTKNDLKEQYPYGFLAVPMSEVVRYGESTGTTGKHTSSFMTKQDWEENIARVTDALLHYYSRDDVVFIMIPYELAFASFDLEKAYWNIGATVVSVGAKNSICPMDRVAEMLMNLKPSSIVCSPTRAIRVYDLLKQKNYEPGDVNLKRIFYIGETCSNAKLEKLKQMWGVELVSVYGSSETNSLSLPCEHGQQHLAEDRFYFELIDSETGDVAPDREAGELVVTALTHQAFPLIRYRTGDLVKIQGTRCSCGSPFRTIRHLGRVYDRICVNNRYIQRLDLEECVLSVSGTGCNFIHYNKDSDLIIAVEIAQDYESVEVLRNVQEAVHRQFDIQVIVRMLDKERVYKVMDESLKPGSIDWNKIFTEENNIH
ncbi:phenylacetate--CoA ligase family protein [Paenibacillus sp. NPDC057934]|uniref:phenylacetate--CoA ligase family protein n=1 Tax=Paenibacillus sp. NPDC057934 TaxID=3346282 RepID=UPI0036D9193F